eukprot:CAMPEP_0177583714 /NCGR_PEP_ID=MMETSP0419_2-20121207/3473_1 /TAXON_ID=582737 /ORGANISM="Tetraselmis sp., Strain GSL018" /LENGTH=273 /DNA_ID=CAMNT_0019073131 /DNA_START=71 /DNA_END=892 /DNA_ORIENTATION=+
MSICLGPGSTLVIAKGDLTRWSAENGAIVNAANSRLLGGSGVDGAIHRRAGPKLLALCKQVPEVEPGVRCPVGEARLTSGETGLEVQHVIHTVGPIYHQETDPASKLESCYRNSLNLANENRIERVAFPAISCGIFGYPIYEAAQVAIKACREHVGGVKEVVFVLFEDNVMDAWMSAVEMHLEHDSIKTDSIPDLKEVNRDEEPIESAPDIAIQEYGLRDKEPPEYANHSTNSWRPRRMRMQQSNSNIIAPLDSGYKTTSKESLVESCSAKSE